MVSASSSREVKYSTGRGGLGKGGTDVSIIQSQIHNLSRVQCKVYVLMMQCTSCDYKLEVSLSEVVSTCALSVPKDGNYKFSSFLSIHTHTLS